MASTAVADASTDEIPLEAELTCPICQDVLVATHVTVPCGHVFCGLCLHRWLDTSQNTCPSCRHVLARQTPHVPLAALDRLVDLYTASAAFTGQDLRPEELLLRRRAWEEYRTEMHQREAERAADHAKAFPALGGSPPSPSHLPPRPNPPSSPFVGAPATRLRRTLQTGPIRGQNRSTYYPPSPAAAAAAAPAPLSFASLLEGVGTAQPLSGSAPLPSMARPRPAATRRRVVAAGLANASTRRWTDTMDEIRQMEEEDDRPLLEGEGERDPADMVSVSPPRRFGLERGPMQRRSGA